jgi:phage/plasmid-associated DNA primase
MDTEHLGGKFSYAGFDQALLVSCLEMPVTRLTASAAKAIKNFTGERRIEIEAKYQNHITAPVRFKTLLASNGGLYLPPGEMDEAFYRRAIVIPFVYSTPLNELIADLPQRWENERSAIISKCVRKLGKILSDDGGLVFPESVQSKEIKANWTGESLVNERFVQNAIQFTARPDDAIPKDDLISIYEEYYSENTYKGKKDRPIHYNKKELVAAIREIYPQVQEKRLRRSSLMYPENTKNVHCLTGIKWSEEMSELIQEAKHKIKDTRRYDEEYEFDYD